MVKAAIDVSLLGDDDVLVEGNPAVVHAEWRVPDSAGALTNPTAVTFTARRESDAPTAYVYGVAAEVTRSSTGIYELALLPAAGIWRVHAAGTGVAQAADDISFEITESGALA